jgi:hypothetical protein
MSFLNQMKFKQKFNFEFGLNFSGGAHPSANSLSVSRHSVSALYHNHATFMPYRPMPPSSLILSLTNSASTTSPVAPPHSDYRHATTLDVVHTSWSAIATS